MNDEQITVAAKRGTQFSPRLAAALLLLVAGTHYGHAPLASLFDDPDAASRALFYAFRGVEGTALFALVGLLSRHPAVWAVCLWGALEESQTAICRIGAGIGTDVGVDLFAGLCGSGWYWGGVVIAALFALWFAVQGARQ